MKLKVFQVFSGSILSMGKVAFIGRMVVNSRVVNLAGVYNLILLTFLQYYSH